MERGVSPTEATKQALDPIIQFYPKFSGALVAVNLTGHYGQFNYICKYKKISHMLVKEHISK